MLPWINATPLDQRRAFIAAYLASDDSIADLATRFRVSRKTAHKFINRYELFGDAGLHARFRKKAQVEPPNGFEPLTCCLRNSCSAAELRWPARLAL